MVYVDAQFFAWKEVQTEEVFLSDWQRLQVDSDSGSSKSFVCYLTENS